MFDNDKIVKNVEEVGKTENIRNGRDIGVKEESENIIDVNDIRDIKNKIMGRGNNKAANRRDQKNGGVGNKESG